MLCGLGPHDLIADDIKIAQFAGLPRQPARLGGQPVDLAAARDIGEDGKDAAQPPQADTQLVRPLGILRHPHKFDVGRNLVGAFAQDFAHRRLDRHPWFQANTAGFARGRQVTRGESGRPRRAWQPASDWPIGISFAFNLGHAAVSLRILSGAAASVRSPDIAWQLRAWETMATAVTPTERLAKSASVVQKQTIRSIDLRPQTLHQSHKFREACRDHGGVVD